MPEGNDRMARRRKIVLAESGCGSESEVNTEDGNHEVVKLRGIIPLPMHAKGNGHAAAH